MKRFRSENELLRFGSKIACELKAGDVVTLSGPLGTGKTTLARGILQGLGHAGEVPSPTFALVQPYDDLLPPVWHVDLYRLETPDEAASLDLEEIIENGSLLVEWPDKGGRHVPEPALAITLAGTGDAPRQLTAIVPPDWEARWANL
ncbi:MAG: tRNA (adenosine(37)-N6)-threonylcarbamoyltransferase complex ATPase subunit type 1 TsaE [Pacificimonas sp.]